MVCVECGSVILLSHQNMSYDRPGHMWRIDHTDRYMLASCQWLRGSWGLCSVYRDRSRKRPLVCCWRFSSLSTLTSRVRRRIWINLTWLIASTSCNFMLNFKQLLQRPVELRIDSSLQTANRLSNELITPSQSHMYCTTCGNLILHPSSCAEHAEILCTLILP